MLSPQKGRRSHVDVWGGLIIFTAVQFARRPSGGGDVSKRASYDDCNILHPQTTHGVAERTDSFPGIAFSRTRKPALGCGVQGVKDGLDVGMLSGLGGMRK